MRRKLFEIIKLSKKILILIYYHDLILVKLFKNVNIEKNYLKTHYS